MTEILNDYQWIGKNRKCSNGGGIGFLYNTKIVSINENNLLNSLTDEFERLWIDITIGSLTIALGVVYFPVDNKLEQYDAAQLLHNEIIQNVAELQQSYKHILVIGDFNGKVSAFLDGNKKSSNGKLIENIIDVTDLTLLNTDEKCTGKITWSKGVQESVIDYAMCSSDLYSFTHSMIVDEEKLFSMGSDHNFLVINLNLPSTSIHQPSNQPCEPEIRKWNITEKSDWKHFECVSKELFKDWNSASLTDINEIWKMFKERLLTAGEKCIGYKHYKNKQTFWNKEVDKLIKNRQHANRLYRLWSNVPNCSPELLSILWDDYMEKKHKVAVKIKDNITKQKTKVIFQNANKGSKNTKAYWNTLRKLNKSNGYPIRIRDPENNNIIIDDPKIISKKLTTYWAGLGNSSKEPMPHLEAHIDQLLTKSPTPNSLQNIDINEKVLNKAISKLKNSKACGVDNLPSEFIKYSDKLTKCALLDILLKIKLLEQIPEEWFEGVIKPLHKEGNQEILSNYRGITISCSTYKVLTSIIEDQMMLFIESHNILGEFQGAFRKKRRCEDHIYTLKGICSIQKSRKKKTYLGFLDISKAFDKLINE